MSAGRISIRCSYISGIDPKDQGACVEVDMHVDDKQLFDAALSIRERISYAEWQAMCERIAVEMQDEVPA
ncbi:MAG: hypothetical protein H7255_16890 [Ramlibacter sp.]|nr:hypothetical protein [Ramlibacter sp.]